MNENSSSASTRNHRRTVGTATPDIPRKRVPKIVPTLPEGCPFRSQFKACPSPSSLSIPGTDHAPIMDLFPFPSISKLLRGGIRIVSHLVPYTVFYSQRSQSTLRITISTVLLAIVFTTDYHRNLTSH